MGELTNKGQRSRVEAYELQTENALLVSGDVKIETGRLAGIDNGKVLDESGEVRTTLAPTVSFYRTRDGRTVLTSAVELEAAEAAIPAIRAFVDAVQERYAQEGDEMEGGKE